MVDRASTGCSSASTIQIGLIVSNDTLGDLNRCRFQERPPTRLYTPRMIPLACFLIGCEKIAASSIRPINLGSPLSVAF
jgi:hypothetical protein